MVFLYNISFFLSENGKLKNFYLILSEKFELNDNFCVMRENQNLKLQV
jgi:hypothetical protein